MPLPCCVPCRYHAVTGLHKSSGKKKQLYSVLSTRALYFYRQQSDTEPVAYIRLEGLVCRHLISSKKNDPKTFELRGGALLRLHDGYMTVTCEEVRCCASRSSGAQRRAGSGSSHSRRSDVASHSPSQSRLAH